jgi:hypothetical protein
MRLRFSLIYAVAHGQIKQAKRHILIVWSFGESMLLQQALHQHQPLLMQLRLMLAMHQAKTMICLSK